MERLGLRVGVILLLIFLLISIPVAQTLALAEGLAARSGKVQSDFAPVHPKIQSTGPQIAGAGLAGAGAAKSLDPVIVRNVIVGLLFVSLWALSVVSNSE